MGDMEGTTSRSNLVNKSNEKLYYRQLYKKKCHRGARVDQRDQEKLPSEGKIPKRDGTGSNEKSASSLKVR